MMSSVNDPAKSRLQMLLSTWWNERHLLQFHPIRCRQQCHSLFAEIVFLQLNSNHKLQAIMLFDCVVISKWQSSFIKKSQVLLNYVFFYVKSRCTKAEFPLKVNKAEGFFPNSQSNAQNATQCATSLISKRIKIQALVLPICKKQNKKTPFDCFPSCVPYFLRSSHLQYMRRCIVMTW